MDLFTQLLDKARKGYGAIDRAVGGVLPGGADSPYVGRSVDPKKNLKFLNEAIDAQTTALVNFGMPLAQRALGALSDKPNSKQDIDLMKALDTVQAVQDKLRGGPQLLLEALAPGENSFFNPNTGRVGVVFDEVPSIDTYATNAPTLLHELGHALNNAQRPYSKAQQTIAELYGTRPNAGDVAALSSYRGSASEDRPLWLSGIEGALSELMTPGTRHTLAEEANATRRAFNLADEFNLPKGRGRLGAAYGTYLTSGLGSGFKEGVIGEIGSRAAEYLADFINDNIVDPALDKARGSEYSPMEEKLRKYGYDERLHRLRQTGFSAPITIESK